MPNQQSPLLVRNLLEVFNERDEAKRLSIIKSLYTEGAVFYEADGDQPIQGHEPISRKVAEVLATLPPGATFRVTGIPTVNHNLGRMSWELELGGSVLASGMDVGIFAGEQIEALYLFIDPPPASKKESEAQS